ncbi:MAG: carotenoid biosynthesis protein, partial [Candidatus Hodarchaeales archaeon]
MSIPLAIVVFEIFVTVTFSGTVVILYLRKSWLDLITLGSATIFGVTLEFLNVLLYETYHYNVLFFLQIGVPPQNIPLCIGMGWGLIIYSSMMISDSINLSNYVRPFIDASLALTIDLSMDAIAIRLEGGFWTWFVPLVTTVNEVSFFGVPYGNFYGWWMVVLIFSGMVRFGRILWANSRGIGAIFFGIVPFLSYIPLYLSLEMIRRTAYLLLWFGFYFDEE